MPELPDVESFKIYLRSTSLRKRIVDVECREERVIKEMGANEFKAKLVGTAFQGVSRRGKFLIVEIAGIPEMLVFHFGMTGDLRYVEQGGEETGQDRFTRLVFKFENGYELRWINVRKLGRVYLVKDLEKIPLLHEMGPEPLTLSERAFARFLCKHGEKRLKAFFLDQRAIAGIGNVYSDEILFRARLTPHRKVKTLSADERSQLYREMVGVLREAIRVRPPRGMLFGALWLLPYRGGGMRCPRNGRHRLKRERVAGRTVVYCPVCQPDLHS